MVVIPLWRFESGLTTAAARPRESRRVRLAEPKPKKKADSPGASDDVARCP